MAAALIIGTLIVLLIVLGVSVTAYYWYRASIDEASIKAKLEHRKMDEEMVKQAERDLDRELNREDDR